MSKLELKSRSRTLSRHIPISILVCSSHELPSLPKTNMKSEGSGNVTGLKFKTRSRTQSRTRSPKAP